MENDFPKLERRRSFIGHYLSGCARQTNDGEPARVNEEFVSGFEVWL